MITKMESVEKTWKELSVMSFTVLLIDLLFVFSVETCYRVLNLFW